MTAAAISKLWEVIADRKDIPYPFKTEDQQSSIRNVVANGTAVEGVYELPGCGYSSQVPASNGGRYFTREELTWLFALSQQYTTVFAAGTKAEFDDKVVSHVGPYTLGCSVRDKETKKEQICKVSQTVRNAQTNPNDWATTPHGSWMQPQSFNDSINIQRTWSSDSTFSREAIRIVGPGSYTRTPGHYDTGDFYIGYVIPETDMMAVDTYGFLNVDLQNPGYIDPYKHFHARRLYAIPANIPENTLDQGDLEITLSQYFDYSMYLWNELTGSDRERWDKFLGYTKWIAKGSSLQGLDATGNISIPLKKGIKYNMYLRLFNASVDVEDLAYFYARPFYIDGYVTGFVGERAL